MKFIPVEELPKTKHAEKCHVKKLEKMLADFMESSNKIVRVEISKNDYVHIGICRVSLYNAVQMYGYPIKVHCRYGHVYLVKEEQ